MGRTKRTSNAVLDAAKTRLAGLKSIDPLLDLGGGLSVASFTTDIQDLDADYGTYNQMLSDIDQFKNRIDTKQKKVGDKSARFLAGIGAKHGKDSDEYEKAGGTRTSERKKPGPRTPKGGTTPTH